MKKEEVEKLFDMLDNVFNNINSKNKSTGTAGPLSKINSEKIGP